MGARMVALGAGISLAGLDVIRLVSYGFIGFSFFLALLSFYLISQFLRQRKPERSSPRAVYIYMRFSIILCILTIISHKMDQQDQLNKVEFGMQSQVNKIQIQLDKALNQIVEIQKDRDNWKYK